MIQFAVHLGGEGVWVQKKKKKKMKEKRNNGSSLLLLNCPLWVQSCLLPPSILCLELPYYLWHLRCWTDFALHKEVSE